MFANRYLEKNSNVALFEPGPNVDLGLIVVIPCLNEPDIYKTVQALHQCDPPKCQVEVIVLVNHSEVADESIKEINWNTANALKEWVRGNEKEGIRFFVSDPLELKKKWAGAGLARKKGMDEAIRRFNLLNKPDGILVSLDADTLVDSNYFLEIESHFNKHKKDIAATLGFEHQKNNLDAKQLEGIELYEQYLHYYKNALEYTGYPFSMFTIGSAFAVKAGAYVKRGGMNRRQAGEDFYFLQNLVQIGPVGQITTTKVYPSARLSDRVPFGTGPILKKWMNDEEDLRLSYNFEAFADLKALFDSKEKLFKIHFDAYKTFLKSLPESVRAFLLHDGFWTDLEELNQNCSTLTNFQNRFFQKMNAFKILKYLNFVHEDFYQKSNMAIQIDRLNQKQQA